MASGVSDANREYVIPFEQYTLNVPKVIGFTEGRLDRAGEKGTFCRADSRNFAVDDHIEVDLKEIEQEMNVVLQQYKRVKDAEKYRPRAIVRHPYDSGMKVFEMLEKL